MNPKYPVSNDEHFDFFFFLAITVVNISELTY